MKKFRKLYEKKILQPPGSIPEPEDGSTDVRITVINYSPDSAGRSEYSKIEDCFEYFDSPETSWINIDGIDDGGIVKAVGKKAGVHPLVLEDIMNPLHRPKIEDYGDYIFIIFKILRFNKDSLKLEQEQVSMILKENLVITFQEYEGDIFDSVRARIGLGEGRIRKMKADYLLSSLLDLVVDNYYPILEDVDELIEGMEEEIHSSESNMTADLYKIQKQVSILHRSVWPNRDVINELRRTENKLVREKTQIFIKDIHDHTLQVLDLVDSFRENITAMMEISISYAGDRLNRIMKFLTLVSTVFIPLTFIAGIYGMNFKNMPELETRYGYFIVLGVMAVIFTGTLLLFKKRKWF